MKSKKKGKHLDASEVDSRAGDFESADEDVISMGSDRSRINQLQDELERNSVTFAEQYNEFKVTQGLQERLEDSELPDNLESQQVFEESKHMHQQQLEATTNREKRAVRTLELMKLCEEILEKREKVRRLEWSAQMEERKAQMRRNQFLLEQKEQHLQLKALEKTEAAQLERFKQLDEQFELREKTPTKHVEVPTVDPILAGNLNRVNNARVEDRVSQHSLTMPIVVDGGVAASDMQATMQNIRAKAQHMIDRKKQTWPDTNIDWSQGDL